MRKLIYIFLVLLLLMSCDKELESEINNPVGVKIQQNGFKGVIIDRDNLENEQNIINISIFLTEPGSDEFFYSAVRNVAFTLIDDYRLVLLPLELSTLGRKDIYVVTNMDNSNLSQAKNLTELKALSTPVVSKNNNLNPDNGLCMFGQTLNFDFNNSANEPAKVYALRTCAKYRINLTFPDNPLLSTSNAFIIKGAASNTCIGENIQANPKYFDFSSPMPLNLEDEVYTNVTYVYEADETPVFGIYLNYSNSNKYVDYEAPLPKPERNCLYDIDVRVYDANTKSAIKSDDKNGLYRFETLITIYNEEGEEVNY